MHEAIVVRGAREHNLKDITVSIPHDRITVVTGPSGSGKSTLAFDTIYAEGHRRYVESLDARARRALRQVRRPDVDFVEGLRPSIAIREWASVRDLRATVGTLTEVYDYLRVLYSTAGVAHCPVCDREINAHSPTQIVEQILAFEKGTRFSVLAPVARAEQSDLVSTFEELRRKGFVRVRIDRSVAMLESTRAVDPKATHDLDLVVDRLSIRDDVRQRLTEAVELALSVGEGRVIIARGQRADLLFTSRYECPEGHAAFDSLTPRAFSFSSPFGACRQCDGLGFTFPLAQKAQKLAKKGREEQLFELLDREIAEFSHAAPCPTCGGARLRPESLAVRVRGRSIAELAELPVPELRAWLSSALPELAYSEALRPVIEAADERLQFLMRVGLGYLCIDRATHTLSTGELQRARLATQIGAGLSGVLYVLDEPTAGLHPADTEELLQTLCMLRDRGNTLVVVEHDPFVMRSADHLVDLGPGAGELGGHVVAQGAPSELTDSISIDYLEGRRVVSTPQQRRTGGGSLWIRGASAHNLENVTVEFKRSAFNCVTGVSGSGKSALVIDSLLPAVKTLLAPEDTQNQLVSGNDLGDIARISVVDATPIGRSARSTPATYARLLDPLRRLYASLPEARARGYTASRFSFNIKGGRCEVCAGEGVQTLRMQLLPDAQVTCELCGGRRYNQETLAVRYRGASIADALSLDVTTAARFFETIPKLRERLLALESVGLGYLQLDRPATTLSSGEAQRLKLARELGAGKHKHTLHILDEPTRGLHFVDVEKLVELLHGLVDRGDTVIVVEHHLDVIKNADHIVDLGPGAGPAGGQVIVAGSPQEVMESELSITGRYLRRASVH